MASLDRASKFELAGPRPVRPWLMNPDAALQDGYAKPGILEPPPKPGGAARGRPRRRPSHSILSRPLFSPTASLDAYVSVWGLPPVIVRSASLSAALWRAASGAGIGRLFCPWPYAVRP